ncbi:uracil-DNA glycosylase-like protein [Trametes maxima]|nr:uracil-DNA glycosylase-like protein [Trametes maxima]
MVIDVCNTMTEETANPEGDTVNTAVTPTQLLRDKLSVFRFEFTPSLGRPPRKASATKHEEVNSVLPALPSGSRSPKKRPAHTPATGGSYTKKAKVTRPTSAKRKIAPSEKYAHLNSLNDYLGQEVDMLDVMFCGINPGQMSATVGHHFAHPTNHFWKCLHGAGLTDRLLPATEDYTLPDYYHLGLTNLVERPSAQAAELANEEFTAGAPVLLRKIVRKRPRVVCFVGKAIWESFIKAVVPSPSDNESGNSMEVSTAKTSARTKATSKKTKTSSEPFRYDLQSYKVVHIDPNASIRETLFFVVVSTSGLVAGYQLPEKIKQFTLLKHRVDELKHGSVDTAAMTHIPISPDLL